MGSGPYVRLAEFTSYLGESMIEPEIKYVIKQDEGKRNRVYLDSVGVPTVGYGHADPEMKVGDTYTDDQINTFFEEDYRAAVADYDTFNFNLDPVRRAVIVMMLFNLGRSRFRTFRKMINCLYSGDYLMAGYEGLDSKWRTQVKGRAHRLMAAIITGKWV